jgi:hypothetical protein
LLFVIAGLVLLWFLAAEVATSFWYSSQEAKLPRNRVPATGEAVMERVKQVARETSADSKEQDIGAAAMEMLKCSYGKTLMWADAPSFAAMTVLKWDERSVVGGVDSMHNPGNCLAAAGWIVGKRTDLGVQDYCGTSCSVIEWEVSRGELKMRAFSAVFRRFAGEDAPVATGGWNSTRLKSVFTGRRDAPLLILLAYLPEGPNPAEVPVRFREIMRSLFCESPAASTPAL